MAAVSPLPSTPLTPAVPAPAPLTLRVRGLLAIYAVIPACVLIYAVDAGLLGHAIRDALPRNPDHLFVFGLLFGWPHIVASNLILVSNREYRQAFGRRALIASAVIIAFFAIGNVTLPYVVLSIVAATATIIHVLKQQIGIGAGAARLPGRLYPAWGWCGIATGVVLYNTLYVEEDLAAYKQALDLVAIGLTGVVVALAIACHLRIASGLGRAFLWGNTSMVVLAVGFHGVGYDIFALAIPRIIHDTTAFAFYVSHDHNRHRAAPRNALYRAAARLPGGIYWLAPVIAIALAFVIEEYGDRGFHLATGDALASSFPEAMSLAFLGYLAMLHYYTEAFTWKAGSPYRRFVAMR